MSHMLKPKLVTAPDPSVWDVADLRARLKIIDTGEDEVLEQLQRQAFAHLDGSSGLLGRAITHQQWRVSTDGFDSTIRLPLGPFVSVDEITYIDLDGASQALPASYFFAAEDHRSPILQKASGIRFPATAARPDAVTVTWTAGMAPSGAEVDERIRGIIAFLVGRWRWHDDGLAEGRPREIPEGVHDMLAPLRTYL
ncbi:MAG: hypothetical protein AAFQ17_00010 [Pseudomonadota bacterium]